LRPDGKSLEEILESRLGEAKKRHGVPENIDRIAVTPANRRGFILSLFLLFCPGWTTTAQGRCRGWCQKVSAYRSKFVAKNIYSMGRYLLKGEVLRNHVIFVAL